MWIAFFFFSFFSWRKPKHHNQTLKQLSENKESIVKLTENGGAVVWGRDQYIWERLRQLTNPDFYLALTIQSFLPAAENKTWVDLVGNF